MTLFSKVPVKILLATALLFLSAHSQAGFVTTHTTDVNNIFNQASFSDNASIGGPIEIRYNPIQTIINDALLAIDSEEEITNESTGLSSLTNTNDFSIDMFFVDDINFCANDTPAVGCAVFSQTFSSINGLNNLSSFTFFDSSFVSGSLGAHVIGHELAHIFGLSLDEHVGDANSRDNLLNPRVASNSSTFLTVDQVNTIFDDTVNSFIQNDNGQFFVEVSPIAVVASVPEPSTYAMFGIGILLLGFHRRRQTS